MIAGMLTFLAVIMRPKLTDKKINTNVSGGWDGTDGY